MSSPILIFTLITAAALIVVYVLNRHSLKKFDYSFFSKITLYVSILYTFFLYGGMYIFSKYNHNVYSWILIIIGIVILGYQIRLNCNETNLWYGLSGSIIQIPLLMSVLVIAFPLLVLSIFFKVMMSLGGSKPLPSKTPYQKQQEWHYNRMNPNGFYKRK